MSEQVAELTQQEQQKRVEIIDRTLEKISKEQWQGFVGFGEWLDGTGYVRPDAGGRYIDITKPEGQQESVIPIRDLALAYGHALENGKNEDGEFVIPVGDTVKRIPERSIYILGGNVNSWTSSRIFEANHLSPPSRAS